MYSESFLAKKAASRINIEIQLLDPYNFPPRTLFYWSKFFVEGVRSGEDYGTLKKTIAINLLGFKLLDDHEKFHSCYRIYEEENKQLLTDLMEIRFIEMPKFEQIAVNVRNPLHRWLTFLHQNAPESVLKEVIMMDPIIEEAEHRLELLGSSDEMRRMYEAREKHLMDEASRMKGAWHEGKEKGKLEGLKEGMKEGKVETARNLLAMGLLGIADIAKATGLSEAEVKALSQK